MELAQQFFAAEGFKIMVNGAPWVLHPLTKAVFDLQEKVGALEQKVAALQAWNTVFQRLNQ